MEICLDFIIVHGVGFAVYFVEKSQHRFFGGGGGMDLLLQSLEIFLQVHTKISSFRTISSALAEMLFIC